VVEKSRGSRVERASFHSDERFDNRVHECNDIVRPRRRLDKAKEPAPFLRLYPGRQRVERAMFLVDVVD